jgi:hypothetical protein
MRIVRSVLLIVVSSPANAAQMYGTVTESGRGIANAPLTVTCGAETVQTATDASGSYSLNVSATGICTFALDGRPGASTSVYSYADPVRYDFDVAAAGGAFSLRKL